MNVPVTRALLLGLLLAPVATLAQDAPQVPKTWGRYTLSLGPQNKDYTQTLKILDGGRVVQTITDSSVSAEVQPIRPGGLPELVVSAYSGGAHCCTTMLLYTQDNGRLENIGVLDMGNYGVNFADLNGDGTKELVVYSDTLAYYDWSYAVSPALKTVLGWDGLRLADQTRFYSYVPAQEAARNLKDAQDALSKSGDDDFDSLKSAVSGYFGNMILAGQGKKAEGFITSQLFPKSAALKAWWPLHRNDLIGATYGQPEARLSIFGAPVWPRPDQDSP